MAQQNMGNGFIQQLMAFGQQNLIYNQNQELYVLDIEELEMGIGNHEELDIQKCNYEYVCEVQKSGDQYKIHGVIIELDKDTEYLKPITNELHKLTLEIYSYKMLNCDKINSEYYFIGSIPLVLGKITNNENSILIKLPNIFFSSQSKYFNQFMPYKFKIKSSNKFRKISIVNIIRYDDTSYRRNITNLSSIFYEHDFQYVISNNLINSIIVENDIRQYKIICEKKIISKKEKSNGIYLTIPEELTEFINKIELNLKKKKYISNNELDTFYKIKDVGYVNLYLIKFDNIVDLEPTNSIEFEFEFEHNENENEEHKDKINKLINDIYVYPIVLNKMVCINYNLRLKYLDGKINDQYNEQQQITLNHYSNNIDLLTETFVSKINESKTENKHSKLECKKFILNYIG